jgi:hypothetical protein
MPHKRDILVSLRTVETVSGPPRCYFCSTPAVVARGGRYVCPDHIDRVGGLVYPLPREPRLQHWLDSAVRSVHYDGGYGEDDDREM